MTQKEKAEGWIAQVKGQLLAQGFQEDEKPKPDYLTMLRELLKLYFPIAANEGFKIRSVDIRAAFPQSKGLDRDV